MSYFSYFFLPVLPLDTLWDLSDTKPGCVLGYVLYTGTARYLVSRNCRRVLSTSPSLSIADVDEVTREES